MEYEEWNCHTGSQMPGCENASAHVSETMGSHRTLPNCKWTGSVVFPGALKGEEDKI